MEEGWPTGCCTVLEKQRGRRRWWRTLSAETFQNPQQWFHVTPTAAQRGTSHTDEQKHFFVLFSNAKLPKKNHCHLSRWRVFSTSPCSVSCDLGVAQRAVSCVQFVHGKESVVSEENCRAAVKPATTVPCLVQVCTFRWEVKPWSQVHLTGHTLTEGERLD